MSWYSLQTKRALVDNEVEALKELGVYPKATSPYSHFFRAHVNVGWLVEAKLKELGVPFIIAGGPIPPPKELPHIPELRDFVYDFLLPYQREAIRWTLNMDGAYHYHAAGCLTGDTEVTVNRAGRSSVMRLDALVHKFNGGESKARGRGGRTWDLSIPTKVQSMLPDGAIRLNRVVAAVSSGVKNVVRVWTRSGRVITATPDHRFFTPNGEVPAGALRAGDPVLVAEWPVRGAQPTKPKPRYVQVDGMQHHPFNSYYERLLPTGTSTHTTRVPLHRLVAEARLNGLTFYELVGRLHMNALDGLKFLDPAEFHVHHKDENTKNNAESNLEVLSGREHVTHHGVISAWKYVNGRAVPDVIVSVEPLPEPVPTFDLTMEGEPNFVANEFVVHNSGKTLAAIVWGLARPGLVVLVCPAKVRNQFASQVRRFTTVDPLVCKGRTVDEDVVLPLIKQARIVVTSWSTLKEWAPVLAKAKPVSVVYDELHRGKQSKRQQRVAVVSGKETAEKLAAATVAVLKGEQASASTAGTVTYKYVDLPTTVAAAKNLSKVAKRRLGSSATPIPNRLRDLWGQLDLLTPWGWGDSSRWMKRYVGAYVNTHGGLTTTGAGTDASMLELKKRLSFLMHYVPKSVSHAALPPFRRDVIYLQAEEQDEASGDTLRELKDTQKDNRGLDRFKGHHHSTLLEIRLAIAASKKRSYVVEEVVEAARAGQKVVVFTGRKKDCDALAKAVEKQLKKENIPDVYFAAAHGDTPVPRREAIKEAYIKAEKAAILIGTGDAWGESLDGLQCTQLGLVVMLPWTPERLIQWEGRFRRHGAAPGFLMKYVVAEGTIDEHVAEVLLAKLSPIEKVLGGAETSDVSSMLATGGFSDEQLAESLLSKILAAPPENTNGLEIVH